jgi:[ribosomal protein S5]-alanine N-acetyltransferase
LELHTERLILKPCTENLISTIANQYNPGAHILGHISELTHDPSLYGWGAWLVMEKATNQVVGDIGFKGKPDEKQAVEIGYGIESNYQNKGYATEAVTRIVDWAFQQAVSTIKADCLFDNMASIKVLEKIGMTKIRDEENMLYWELKAKKYHKKNP